MSFSINTNIASLNAQNNLSKSSNFQAQTINKVTSGLRIVNSGDDAAGLAIANGLRSDQAVLNQGIQNGNNGLASLQTVDSGMNNISTLLDRARTLATESASGTFSGDRSTLNGEFQSVVSEITRQATSIGMNQGGQFAQALNVFIGGGKGASANAATQNGTISMDLSKSSVDAQSLGLQGVQASGNSSVDLSSSNPVTSVQSLIADSANKSSEATSGFTTFSFKGPGFSDGSAISVSVNLAGVTDTQTLASAINSAIQSAGNGATAAATAFKNSNISASVISDSNGQHLSFSSSTAAFQVQAGDRTANALLGNISSGSTGASLQTTFSAGSALSDPTTTVASQNTTINLQFQGAGMTQPHTVSVAVNAQDTLSSVLTSLTSAVQSDATLAKAGITLDTTQQGVGNHLTFQSTSGQQFSVQAGGDVDNLLGLGSTRVGGASATVQYSTITGGAAYDKTTAQGTAHFQVSFNGGAAVNLGDVDLTQGDATATNVTGGALTGGTVNTSANNQLSITIDGTKHSIDLTSGGHNGAAESISQVAADITTQLGGAGTATVNSSNQLVITSASKGAASSVVIGSAPSADASTALKLTGAAGATTTAGTSRTGADIQNFLNQQIASNSTLSAAGLKATFDTGTNKLTVASTNNTNFQLNAYADNTKGSVAGTLAGGHASITGTVTTAQTINSTNQNLRVNVDGTNYDVKLTTGSRTTAQIASDIQSVFTSAGSSATATTDAGGHVVITSGSGGTNSSVTISNQTNPNDASTVVGLSGAHSGAAAGTATAIVGSSSTLGTIDGTHSNLDITIDGTNNVVDLTGATTMTDVVNDINTAFSAYNTANGGTVASLDVNGKLQLNSLTTGISSEVKVAVAGSNDASTSVNLTPADNLGTAATAGKATGTATGSQTIDGTNDKLDLSIDGTQYQVTLTQGTRTMAQIASDVNTAVGSSVATVDGGGHLVVTSGTTGINSNVTVGNNDAFDGATVTGIVGKSNTGSGSFAITAGTNDTLTFKVDGGSNQSITLTAGASLTATSVRDDINAKLTAAHITGIAASVDGSGDLVLSSQFAGSGHSVQVVSGGTHDVSTTLGFATTAKSGTDANVGFGFTGAALTANSVGAAPTASPDVLSAGAYQTAGLSFSALKNGSDNQTINITATDASGASHTSNIVLKNNSLGNADSLTGGTIDSAVNAINGSLQQSNNSALQSVAAVKYNNAGTEEIKFVSANTSFSVTVGNTGDNSGMSSQGTTVNAALTNGGSTADISTQNGAEQAVNALALAVQKLGTAQAAVGKGENNLNYAISLATSQTTNEAAAESQIRDANLAQEAANLSRAQILVQAGTAALAQANSAPQQLLSLLQH
jgi:flagellin